jgi:hypothetical protein
VDELEECQNAHAMDMYQQYLAVRIFFKKSS